MPFQNEFHYISKILSAMQSPIFRVGIKFHNKYKMFENIFYFRITEFSFRPYSALHANNFVQDFFNCGKPSFVSVRHRLKTLGFLLDIRAEPFLNRVLRLIIDWPDRLYEYGAEINRVIYNSRRKHVYKPGFSENLCSGGNRRQW